MVDGGAVPASAAALTFAPDGSLVSPGTTPLRRLRHRYGGLARSWIRRQCEHPVTLVTDGELQDAGSMSSLPRGSRVEVIESTDRPDASVVSVEAPRAVVSGDTVEMAVAIRAGTAGGPARALRLFAGGRELARVAIDALPPDGERRTQPAEGSSARPRS